MKNNIIITIKKELRGIIRDKKSLMMMLLTPLMIPLFIFIFSFVYDNMINDETIDKYNIGINYSLTNTEKEIIKNLNFETIYYSTRDKLQDAYETGKIDAYIILNDTNNYSIYANNMNQTSYSASVQASMYLDNYNQYLAQNYLTNIGANLNNVYNNISYSTEDLVGSNDLVNEIITMGFIFAIMAITLTAIYSATDTTAGEKERGTLETFLTFPVKSEELIAGKYLAISVSCFVTSIISTLLIVISLSISSQMFDIFKDTVLNFNIITIITGLLIMFAYSLFISGLCIAIASLSKSYKEAQSTLTPISLITMVPMFFDLLGMELNPILSLIPIVNHALLLEIIFCQSLTFVDTINILIMFISTIIYSIIIIKLITKMYKSEKVLFAV